MTLESNKYLEYTFDIEEITSFNFNDIKLSVNKQLADEDSYNIIIFNMSKVKYLDSTGINFFLNLRKKTEKEIILKNCTDSVKKLFEVLNVVNLFEFV